MTVRLDSTGQVANATFDRIIAVNLAGVFNCLKHEIRQMRAQRSRSVCVRRGCRRGRAVAVQHERLLRHRVPLPVDGGLAAG